MNIFKINKDKGYTFYMGSRGYGKSVATKLQELDDLKTRINKAIEYIDSQSPDAGVSGHHIKTILKGGKNENN